MTPVVIVAGGLGSRLHGLTQKKPKPMLPVGGKPVLENIINGFIYQGFTQIWISVNYKAELIQDYFGDGSDRGAKIKYIHEEEKMDSGGWLHVAPKFKTPFIVTNSDIVISPPIDYGRLMEHHARSNCEATVCIALHQYQVPYGVARFNNGLFVGLDEKPIENFDVNGGVYVFNPEVMKKLPEGAFPMTKLLSDLELSAYPITGYWQDIGHFEDYARANANL